MWTDTVVPNRDRVESSRWGIAPSIGFGVGTATRATVGYFKLTQDNLPEYGLPWVPANTNPELAAYANGMPPVEQSNFYGLTTRDYEKTDTDLATIEIERDVGAATTLRNLTRWGKNVRDSVITAPRFASVNTSTATQPPAAVARHDRHDRRQPDQPDGARRDRPRRPRHGRRRWSSPPSIR